MYKKHTILVVIFFKYTQIEDSSLVKNKYTKMYLKYIYFMLNVLQIRLHIYAFKKTTLQMYI